MISLELSDKPRGEDTTKRIPFSGSSSSGEYSGWWEIYVPSMPYRGSGENEVKPRAEAREPRRNTLLEKNDEVEREHQTSGHCCHCK
jgi:hypothetical protein